MTTTRTARTSGNHLRTLRRVPLPANEPPYDDERADWANPAPTQGTLALQLPAPATTPRAPERHLRLVPNEPERSSGGLEVDDPFFAPQPTPRSVLPDPQAWSRRYVQALVEVLAGERPVAQLMRWTTDGLYAQLQRRVHAAADAARPSGPPSPHQANNRVSNRTGRNRTLVKSVHVCEPTDGVAEVAIHVRDGARSRAVAMRLEGWDGRWRCMALRVG